jgi:hypothetical protein
LFVGGSPITCFHERGRLACRLGSADWVYEGRWVVGDRQAQRQHRAVVADAYFRVQGELWTELMETT